MRYQNDDGAYPVSCRKRYIFHFWLSSGAIDKFINKIIENEEVIQKIKEVWKNITEIKIKYRAFNEFYW